MKTIYRVILCSDKNPIKGNQVQYSKNDLQHFTEKKNILICSCKKVVEVMCVPLLDKHRVTPEKRMGVCHTHCVALYVNNGGKHTDDDLDFGKSLGVGWEP